MKYPFKERFDSQTVSVAEGMQKQLTAQKTGKHNKENLWRTVDVLAVASTQIMNRWSHDQAGISCYTGKTL